MIALSAHASDMSSWLFMAFPAAIMLRGLSQSWIAIGLLLGVLNWQLLAKRLRIATEKLESYTLSTFFERRFRDASGLLRTLTALMTILFLAVYLSAGLMSIGMVLESVFGINYYFAFWLLATFVVLIYTFVGGFITVAWTDLFQALFLLAVILFVPFYALSHVEGGWQTIISLAQSRQIGLTFFEDTSSQSLFTILFLVLGWGLGYFGQPHIITKFMGIKNASEMYKSKYVGMTWMIVALSSCLRRPGRRPPFPWDWPSLSLSLSKWSNRSSILSPQALSCAASSPPASRPWTPKFWSAPRCSARMSTSIS